MEQTILSNENDFLEKNDIVELFLSKKDEVVQKEKSKGVVDFDAMLSVAAKVLKIKENAPQDIDYSNHESVYNFLNKKPKAFQAEIVKHMISQYYTEIKEKNRLPMHHAYESKKKLTKEQLVSVNVAFGLVSGHTYSSFLNLLKSRVYDNFGRETLKALNYLKISNLTLSRNVNYTKCLDSDPTLVEKIKNENLSLFYPSVLMVGFKGLNQYKELKEEMSKKGLTKKGWKNMCAQTANYNLRAIRKKKLGAFCLNNSLKDAWLRNSFMALWFKCEYLRGKEHILLKEIENYNGHVNKFEPFPVLRPRLDCVQLTEINDYLRATPDDDSKTLTVLYRRSIQWHENSYRKAKGLLFNFKKREITEFEESGYKFEQILDSHKLYDEGETMHHCVFSYTNSCSKEKYTVFKVFGEGKSKEDSRATLGIYIKEEEDGNKKSSLKYTFNQMYGYCNSRVSDDMHKAAKLLIKKLNAEAKAKIDGKVNKKAENIKIPSMNRNEVYENEIHEDEIYF